MWFGGVDNSGIARIGYATSPDGINWMKYDDPATTSPMYIESDPVLPTGSSWESTFVSYPYVMKEKNVYKMWYTGCNPSTCGIGYAESSDGINWTKSALNPILVAGPSGAWDDARVAEVSVLQDYGDYKMWYSGDEGSNTLRIGYAIFPEIPYEKNGEGYKFLTTVPSGTNYYVHQNTGEGNPNNYFYYVQANTSLAFRFSKNNSQVAKYTKNYEAGRYLISVPLMLDDSDIVNVLKTVKYDVAWSYNSTDILDHWKLYNPMKPFNDLATVDYTAALWIIITEDSNLTVAGIVPKKTNILLKAGWNLVGYPSFFKNTISNALNSVPYERIESYADIQPDYLRILYDSDMMMYGGGYWIKVSADTKWSLTN